MSKKSYRNITINDQNYRWKIGRQNLEIRSPENKTYHFDVSELINDRQPITPKYVADLIYKEILKTKIPTPKKEQEEQKSCKIIPKERTYIIFRHHYDSYGGIYIPILFYVSDDAKKTKEIYNKLSEAQKNITEEEDISENKPFYTTHAVNKDECLTS